MKLISSQEAAALIGDEQTVLIGGSGGGHAIPDAILEAIQERYSESRHPRAVTSIHPVGLGDGGRHGVSHLAAEGLLRRIVCGTLVDAPPIADLAARDRIEAYTLPQGALSQLIREIAAGRPGLFTHVGLHTFVDPDLEGGRQSPSAVEDLVERVELNGRTWLFYKPFSIDVALLRATTADTAGNLSMENEPIFGEMLSMAQATRRCGGVVVAQVEQVTQRGTIPGKAVKVPGFLVDYVVVEPYAPQTFESSWNPAYAGHTKVPWEAYPVAPLSPAKIIARRAAMELRRGAVCNVGSGVMTGVGQVVAEERLAEDVWLTNEQGLIGGIPAGGFDSGAATNFECMIDQPYQFDFYDGGGLDIAFLSFAEIDATGAVNISRFGDDRIVGVGGFINISQNAKHVVFGGYFTAGGLNVELVDGKLAIHAEGRARKFVLSLRQVSYSARYADERGHQATYITERAVFRRRDGCLLLTEIAPGVDVERDVLNQMSFTPEIAPDLAEMDPRLFVPGPMGLELPTELTEGPTPSLSSGGRR